MPLFTETTQAITGDLSGFESRGCRGGSLSGGSPHTLLKSSRAAGGHGLRCQGALAWVSFPEPNALVGTLTLTLPPGVFYPSRECVSPGTSHWTVGRRGRIYGPGVRTELDSAGLKGGDIWEPGWETPGHPPLQMGLSQRRRELPPIFTTDR